MTEFLLRLFVKEYRRGDNAPAEAARLHASIGKMAGIVGILCNVFLFLGKAAVGVLAGSVSILADAVNSLSDAASSIVTLYGFRMARRPADHDHPYGHARYEYLAGVTVAVLILVMGAELARTSFGKILRPAPVHFTAVTGAVLLVAACVKIWLAAFYRKLGNKIRSTTLRTASADSRNDAITSAIVLTCCLIARVVPEHVAGGWFAGGQLDGITGLLVALFILYSGVGALRETVSPLLGKQVDSDLLERIRTLVLSHDKILGVHDLLVHDYGPGQYFASLHAELSAEEDPLACHDILDAVEQEAWEQLGVHLVIHYDPVAIHDRDRSDMLQRVKTIVHAIDPCYTVHDLRVVHDHGATRLVFDLAVPYAALAQSDAIRDRINAALAADAGPDSDAVCTAEIRFDGPED